MKRQQISEREHVEAEEKASRHRDELLEELREREAARRTPSSQPAPPTTPEAAAPEPTSAPSAPQLEPEQAPESTAGAGDGSAEASLPG